MHTTACVCQHQERPGNSQTPEAAFKAVDSGQWTEGREEARTATMQSHFPGCTDVLDASTHPDIATGEERPPNDIIIPRKINWANPLRAIRPQD